MPVNFNILAQTPSIGARFAEGQQFAQEQAQNAFMRQQQAENFAAQREQRLALAEERRAKQADAMRRQQFLEGLSAKMAEGGHKLDRPTLSSMLQFGMQNREDALINLATQGLKALDEEDLYQREGQRLGVLQGAAPSVKSGAEPASANALAAPAFSRPQVQQMLLSPSARIREQGKALAGTLPPEPATPADVATMKSLGYPLTPQGYAQFREAQRQERLLSPEEEAQRVRIAQASRPPAQPKEPSAPVAVVDENTGSIKYVTREQALGRTPAAAIEALPPKEIQKREASYPQATSAIKGYETKSDAFIKDLKALRDDPGLDQITGAVYGRLGSVSRAGSRAQALYDKITAKGGFQALQDLRDASKTGGALGNVSNQEGKQLTSSFAAIDRRQAKEDVQAAIDQAIADIEGSKTRMREAYESTYSYKSGRGGAAVPSAGAAPAAPKSGATVSNW